MELQDDSPGSTTDTTDIDVDTCSQPPCEHLEGEDFSSDDDSEGQSSSPTLTTDIDVHVDVETYFQPPCEHLEGEDFSSEEHNNEDLEYNLYGCKPRKRLLASSESEDSLEEELFSPRQVKRRRPLSPSEEETLSMDNFNRRLKCVTLIKLQPPSLKRSCRRNHPHNNRPSACVKRASRIPKYCTVPGCSSTTKYVKLSNHLSTAHPELSPEERAQYLRAAKNKSHQEREEALTLKGKRYDVVKQATTVTHKMRSTRSFPRFPKEHPELVKFHKFLTSLDGKKQTEKVAKMIIEDVNKYLYYANDNYLNWGTLLNKECLSNYLDYLEQTGACGIDGRIQKLRSICEGLVFIRSRDGATRDEEHAASSVLRDLKAWFKPLAREKKKKQIRKREEQVDSLSKKTLNALTEIANCKEMWTFFNETVERAEDGEDIPERDVKQAMGAVMMNIMLRSWARPTAAINCTLEEWEKRTRDGDVTVIKVKEHKTAVMGHAKLCCNEEDLKRMKLYFQHIRPLMLTGKGKGKAPLSAKLFILPGEKNLISRDVCQLIKQLSTRFGFPYITSTMVRKLGTIATMTDPEGSSEKLLQIQKQLCHTPRNSRDWYQLSHQEPPYLAVVSSENAANTFRYQEMLRHKNC